MVNNILELQESLSGWPHRAEVYPIFTCLINILLGCAPDSRDMYWYPENCLVISYFFKS
jgi:hypothetical protein